MDIAGIADYFVGFLVMAGIYAVFSLGLNVHWGYTGLFNIGIAGFFALGAYTAALMTTQPPDPTLFEDFKFGGNWSEIAFPGPGNRPVVLPGSGGRGGGLRGYRPGNWLHHPATPGRLSCYRNAGHRGVGPTLLPEREVGGKRLQGAVQDTQVPGAIGYRPKTTTTCTWLWCLWSWPSSSCPWSRWSSLPGGGCCVR